MKKEKINNFEKITIKAKSGDGMSLTYQKKIGLEKEIKELNKKINICYRKQDKRFEKHLSEFSIKKLKEIKRDKILELNEEIKDLKDEI